MHSFASGKIVKWNQMRRKMTKSEVGRLGALARMRKYGNPGAAEGRAKGGMRSIKTHKKLKTNFSTEKNFRKPKNSAKLAEFMGIMIGDGHLAKYQASVSTSSKTDIQHAIYVKNLATSLFGIPAVIRKKKNCNAVEIVISSVGLVRWLNKKGMPNGNKMAKLSVPKWIQESTLFQKGFLRGLFDTDGCIFKDRHVISEKTYISRGWTITSFSARLRNEVVVLLQGLGFNPTLRDSQVSVHMRRKADIDRYFKTIGTNNPKHLARYLKK